MTEAPRSRLVDVVAVEVRRLTKSYGSARGIVDVDLTVGRGQVMGLVGANGAGKTTLMRTLLDFIRPTTGAASVLGHDSRSESVAVRRRTTYLPGELVLPPRLTGHGAVHRFALARPDLDPARVSALADRLELDLSRRVGDLSKGNRQKIGLVLAFAPSADLLVLDEPTSGLDPLLQREFAALVSEAVRDGATVLLSSHVMAEVEQIASHVALMCDGRVVTVDAITAITAAARRRARAVPRTATQLAGLSAALGATPGVTDVHVDGGAVAFSCTGDMDAAIKALAGFPLLSLDVTHADLEDAFFSQYDGPDATGGSR